MGRSVDKACVSFLADMEGFRSGWYQDVAGVWTIGHGMTEEVPGVSRAEIGPITRSQSRRFLRKHLEETYVPPVDREVRRSESSGSESSGSESSSLAAHKRWALYSFCYNVGTSAFLGSTLLEELHRGNEEAAEKEFLEWVFAGGEVWEGLVRRRKAEQALFELDEEPEPEILEGLVVLGKREYPRWKESSENRNVAPGAVPAAGVERHPTKSVADLLGEYTPPTLTD